MNKAIKDLLIIVTPTRISLLYTKYKFGGLMHVKHGAAVLQRDPFPIVFNHKDEIKAPK